MAATRFKSGMYSALERGASTSTGAFILQMLTTSHRSVLLPAAASATGGLIMGAIDTNDSPNYLTCGILAAMSSLGIFPEQASEYSFIFHYTLANMIENLIASGIGYSVLAATGSPTGSVIEIAADAAIGAIPGTLAKMGYLLFKNEVEHKNERQKTNLIPAPPVAAAQPT